MAAAAQAFASAGLTKVEPGTTFATTPDPGSVNTPPPSQVPAPEVKPGAAAPPPVQAEGEKPATIIPPVTTPAPEVDIFSKIGDGKFKSVEEINGHLTTLDKKTKENPFVNDRVKGLNDAVRAGIDPELYWRVSSIDVDKLTPKEALQLQLQMRDKLSPEDAAHLVDSTYRLDGEKYADDDPDTKTARIRSKVDANAARDFLKGYISESLTTPKEQRIEQQKNAWATELPKVMDSFKTLPVETKNGKFSFPVSEATQVKARELFDQVISSGMVEAMPDETGIAFAKNVVYSEILKMELTNIVDGVVNHIKEQELNEKHNPRRTDGGGAPPPGTDQNSIANFLAKQHGVKLQTSN